jgi:ATPase subunit of ABC transporter with duplicated ATPase domains
VNGAGKTTQLQIVMGKQQADSGEVVKAKKNMRIAYLAQVSFFSPYPRLYVYSSTMSLLSSQSISTKVSDKA